MRGELRAALSLPGGHSLDDHMRVVARAKGLADSLPRPDPPLGCEEIVLAFLDLHRSRPNNGFGTSPIALAEVESWCRLNRVEFTSWELEALLALDAVALEVKSEQANRTIKHR